MSGACVSIDCEPKSVDRARIPLIGWLRVALHYDLTLRVIIISTASTSKKYDPKTQTRLTIADFSWNPVQGWGAEKWFSVISEFIFGWVGLLCAQHLKSDRFSMKKTLNRVSGGLWTKELFRESTTYDYNASISSPPCMSEESFIIDINSHVNHDKPYPLTLRLFSSPCVFINIPNLC